MSNNTNCCYYNSNKERCNKTKIINFCKLHKYLENKVEINNLTFCEICNCVLTNDMSEEMHTNLKCNKCINIIFCKGITQKNKTCNYKALANDDYCELHQSYKKWKELTDKNIKVCSNWIRGCWNNILNDGNNCSECVNKSEKKGKINNQLIEIAIKYNNTNEDKMCIKCNNIFNNDDLLENDLCKICDKKSKLNVDNYIFKDVFEKKISDYKRNAIERSMKFKLSNNDCCKLFNKKCYYCGFVDQEYGIGIDRMDNSKGYIKSNCVPCCTICNIMKRNYNFNTFIKICQHIATVHNKFNGEIDYSLFESSQNTSYIKYLNKACERGYEFELSLKTFNKLINSKCYYCHSITKTETFDGSGGIDRKNNSIGYTKNNCVACCKTCNIMKHTQHYKEFINKCNIISHYRTINIDEDLEDTLINKLYESLEVSIRVKPEFIHSYDYYNSRIWHGDINDVSKIKICLEFVDSKDQKDLWNYYRYYVSSLETFKTENFFGRTICILVKDLDTRKYLGIMSLSSDIKDLKDRDTYIGWNSDDKFKNKMLNRIMNLSTCVSLQPFGFNFNGGKLLSKLIFSKEVMDKFYEKYNEELLGIITTGLYGKSIQYDRLKELKFIGMTSGSSVYKISPEITKLCREYLLTYHNKVTTHESKLHVLSDALFKLKLPREKFLTDNPKGIYFGYTYENSKKILCGKKKTPKNILSKPSNEIFNDWYNRWAIQRYNHLKNTDKLKEFEYISSQTRVKIFRQKQIENNGLEKYLQIVSEQNKIYNEENKEKIKNYKSKYYEDNIKKATNNKSDDYLHLDNNIDVLKPDLPNNISLFKEGNNIYIQYSKKKGDNKIYCKNKIRTIKIQEELDKIITKINTTYPDLKINTYTIKNSKEWDSSKELHNIICPPKAEIKKDNRELIESHERKIVTQESNANEGEFKLPKNINILKINDDYYFNFVKSKDGQRYKKMSKITTNNFQNEYDKFIDLINDKYKDLVNFKKEKLYNIPTEYTNVINNFHIQLVDNNNKNKPKMPNNFSICKINDIDYIQFNKTIDEKRYQYKTKINSYDLQLELNNFIDYLNNEYGLELNKQEYIINNYDNWQTTNKIIIHEDSPKKEKLRENARKYINRKKQQIGEEEYKKQKAEYAKNRRHNQL